MLFSTVIGKCNKTTCPIMTVSPKWEFYWSDQNEKFKRPQKMCALEYVETLLNSIKSQIDDESQFPLGQEFPKKFDSTIKNIFKRLVRVYGHLYYSHYEVFRENGVDNILNTSFKHFMFFVLEFELVAKKDLIPYEELIVKINV
jgi:MOB kinase activator 1